MGFLPKQTFFYFKSATLSESTLQSYHLGDISHKIQGTSKKVRRVLNEEGVKVVRKLVHNIGQILPFPEDPTTVRKKIALFILKKQNSDLTRQLKLPNANLLKM